MGTIALLGAGSLVALAQQAATAQADPAVAATAKNPAAETDTAKTAAASKPVLLAQQTTVPQPAASSSDTSEAPPVEIVVTGSMIARPSAETAEAITVLKADSLKNLGITSVEGALGQLTSNTPSINVAQSVGTFSGGGTYANLRNLGNGRTLVLLDGQRLANNAFTGNAVDLTGIPLSAIDNVQELREGASALYGSDAIAGVINFVTKKNYQGLEVEGTLNHPQESGGGSGLADITFGHGDLVNDGYNFMITANYQKQQELQATQRSFSAAGYYPQGGVYNTNNPGTWPGSVLDNNGNFYQYGYPACAGNPFLTTDPGNCAYRYSAATDLVPKSDVISALASVTKQLPGDNTLQLQYFWTQSTITAFSGPMFYFFQMNPSSPYFPKASQLTCTPSESVDCTQAPDLTDPINAVWTDPANSRYSGNVNTEQRVLLSFAGTSAGWDYKALFNYSISRNDDRNVGGYPNEALLAPNGVLSNLINPFGPQSAAGQALIDSSYTNGVYQNGVDRRWSVDGNASHPLWDVFHAGSPATLALGVSVQGEHFAAATTPYNDIVQAATGLSDSSVEGSRQAQALYVELFVPITKQLDLDLSDREDRYSDFGTTNNGKISVRYQPADFLTFRGNASTGFRAPTLYNLYTPKFLAASSSGTMGQGNPECNPPSATGLFTAATCNTQGLGLYGGNNKLTPETSQNYDIGVVISPIRDMGITLDYYRILVKNTISAVPASAIYGDPTTFASYIVPNSAGTLTPSVEEAANCLPSYTQPTCGYIVETDVNTGEVATNGVDLSVQYQQHTPIGTFHEDLEGTAVTEFRYEQYTGGPFLNLVGWYNESAPAYRWSHNLRVNWTSLDTKWGAGLENLFYSSYIDEYPDGNGNRRTVGSYSTWNVYASYAPIEKLSLVFGIKNLFNQSPPFTNASQGNFAAGYNSLIADPFLRSFYLNVKYKIF